MSEMDKSNDHVDARSERAKIFFDLEQAGAVEQFVIERGTPYVPEEFAGSLNIVVPIAGDDYIRLHNLFRLGRIGGYNIRPRRASASTRSE